MELVIYMLLLLLTLTIFKALFSKQSKASSSSPHKKLPPGPSPLPIIGNLLALGKKPHQSLARLAQIHGPIMSLKIGQVTTIVVSSAEMAKEVLLTHDQSLSNRSIPHAVQVHNHHQHSITFLPISPLWRDLRKLSNGHLFSNTTLDSSQSLRRKKLLELVTDINQSSLVGEVVDIGRMVFKTSINLLSNTMFSEDLVQSAGSAGDFKDLVVKIMEECGKPNLADFFPVLGLIDPQGIKSRNTVYAGKILDIFRRLIRQRWKLRESQGFDSNNDMLKTLLNIIAQTNGQEMNETQIEHLGLTLFVAGTDTITSTLEWAMAELIKNEKVMAKAKQELEQIIGKGKPVEESDIGRLPYLQAVIKETFRLHPAVPFLIPRKAVADVEIEGYRIPKDTQVWVNVWAIGRSSSIWKNPNLFSPERFLNSEIDVKGHHYELAPFGAGRRVCIGLSLSMRMINLMLGSLINCFNWKLEDGVEVDDMNMEDSFGITLAKAKPVRAIPEKIRSVKVSNISSGTTEKDLKEFLTFPGKIELIEMQRNSQVAYVTFSTPEGAETAVLLSGAVVCGQSISIELASDYVVPASSASAKETGRNDENAESGSRNAEDVVSSMLARGFILGKDALNRAKSFDEKHQLSSTATAKVVSLDNKVGFSERINAGTILVNDKVKEMDEKFQVSEKTKSAMSAAERSVASAGSAIMRNRYVFTGAAWVTGAYNRVAKKAEQVGQKTKEKVLAEDNNNQGKNEGNVHTIKPEPTKPESQPPNPPSPQDLNPFDDLDVFQLL
ncbi:hypothetical protein RJT34_31602 [Clitoria ternatea]|uniref:RRM domain-containing protein n=1 Tax=Clitoria ternatea TaxID=43366 RepID=A0AAN9EWQ7_CLITE